MARFWGRLWRLRDALATASKSVRLELGFEEVSIDDCLGRVIAEDIVAPCDIPYWDTSVVDGYAVKASDIVSASPSSPIQLRVKGVLEPSDPPDKFGVLESGWAIEVYTGSPLPVGADTVVMYEDVVVGDGYIEVTRSLPRWANVSRRGEDVRGGDIVVKENTLLNQFHVTVLAILGYSRVRVYERIRVGLLSVGDELVPVGSKLEKGRKYASTEYLLLSMLSRIGFVEPRYYGVVGDDIDALADRIEAMARENHVLVTIGGTSVSRRDVVPDYVEENGEWIIRGIALRPGRTTSLAVVHGRPLFLLSGHVVAAWVGYKAFLEPLLHRWIGLEPPRPCSVKATLKRRIANPVGYRSFVRTRVWRENGRYYAEPYMVSGSNIVSSLLYTQGYIVVPEDLEGYEVGDEVDVYFYD